MKIPNRTEVAVIFERIDQEGMATMFYPVKVVLGYADKKRKVFVASDGNEYSYLVSTMDKYSFGLRNTVGQLNRSYQEKTLSSLLKTHLMGLEQFVYYFRFDSVNNDFQLVCEDGEENVYIIDDKDFNSYKRHFLEKNNENKEEELHVKVDSKNLINEVKKTIIGQDDAVEDIVSIIWQNSMSDRKQNILLVGPTGVGKTEIIRIIAKELNIPMVIANASSMTQSGYIGKSVDDVLNDLLIKCNNDVKKAENSIIVIDEIDKLASHAFSNNDVATSGVQDELLKLVEDGEYTINISDNAYVKNNVILNTGHITFIAMGAFSELLKEKRGEKKVNNVIGFGNSHVSVIDPVNYLTTDDLVKYGLKQELIGRFTNIIELNSLTKEHLIQIMKNPNEKLINDKIRLLNDLGVSVKIDDSVYEKLANIAISKNTGARGLIGAVDHLFVKAMTEISQNDGVYEKLSISEETISNPKRYILEKKSNK